MMRFKNMLKVAAPAALLLTLTVSAARAGWLDDLRGKWDSFRAGQSAVKIPADLTGATIDYKGFKIALTDARSGKVLNEEPDPDESKALYSVSGSVINLYCAHTYYWKTNRYRTRYLVGKEMRAWEVDEKELAASPAVITVTGRKGKVLTGVLNGFWSDDRSDDYAEIIKDAPVTITLK